jgi:hypothetical protein
MPNQTEILDKGLWDARDPAIMPEGALQRAKNTRYHVGDPALWQAEGRARLGVTKQHSYAPIRQCVGLRWDPGTKYSETKEMLSQILYHDGASYAVIQAEDAPSDPAHDDIGTIINRDGTVQRGSPGADPLEAVQIGSEWVLLSGAQPELMARAQTPVNGTTRQYLRPLGMPTVGLGDPQDPRATVSNGETFQQLIPEKRDTTVFTDVHFEVGFHFYWWTWYNSTDKVEGGCTAGAASYMRVPTPLLTGGMKLYLPKSLVDAAPSSADYIRIYKTPALEGRRSLEGATTPQTAGWPVGFRVLSVAISTIQAAATSLQTAGDGSQVECYLVDSVGFDGVSEKNDYTIQLPLFNYDALFIPGTDDIPYMIDGYPPAASTGTIFEGSLLTNDKSKRNRIRWSVDDNPDAFPTYNFMDFDTDDYDQVNKVKAMGTICLVYLDNSVYRIDWLPTSRDPLFSRGRARDIVDNSRGAVWERAVAEFTHPTAGPLQAFVHTSGIYATNGDVVFSLLHHVDWKNIAPDPAGLKGNCWLVNNPDEQRLEFYHRSQVWYIHYDLAHMPEMTPAVTGPIERPAGIEVATPIRTRNGKTITVTVSSGGLLHYEGFGFTDETAGSPNLFIDAQTRDMYLNGPGNEFRISHVFLHIKPGGVGGSAWDSILYAGDSSGEVADVVERISLNARQSRHTTHFLLADYASLRILGVSTDAAMGVNFISLGWEDYGDSESGTAAEV